MKSIVFTLPSISAASSMSLEAGWPMNSNAPPDIPGVNIIVANDIAYCIHSGCDDDQIPIVVVNLAGDHGVFVGSSLDQNMLDRISHVARSCFTNTVSIPPTWRPYHRGNIFSIYAAHRNRGDGNRIVFKSGLGKEGDLLVCARTEGVVSFDSLLLPIELHEEARDGFTSAILHASEVDGGGEDIKQANVLLSGKLEATNYYGVSLDEWYKSKLLAEQRLFVDMPYDGPVRLRGSAGTGKTLSLVVKFLRDAERFEARGQKRKFCFITHSVSSAEQVVELSSILSPTALNRKVGSNVTLEIRTLYDIANSHLRFELDELAPLSLDGREGRLFQFDLISEVLKSMHKATLVRAKYAEINPSILESWNAAAEQGQRKLVSELMNEFASVIDAGQIRAQEEKGEEYAKGTYRSRRPAWLMQLPNEIDRRFVLEVHRRYRKMLGEMNTISVDQMVADFDSFLESNRWDRIRNREGFDALFVDELHLFTSLERQVLHKLMCVNVEDGKPKRPPIFMAYDLKQSPNDAFTEYREPSNKLFSKNSNLQKSELVELSKVFRFTPEIAEFLTDLDSSFPGMDIPGEWDAYVGDAQLESGEKPILREFADETSQFRAVFEEAAAAARTVEGKGGKVAILCMSEEVFDKYVVAAKQYEGKVILLSDRDTSSSLKHAGKRFVFSMPEYVAGLQFDTVFLISADQNEAPIESPMGFRRRFISNAYLGASRAKQRLVVTACTNRGGPADVLELALERSSLVRRIG